MFQLMRRIVAALLIVCVLAPLAVPAAEAAVNVNRQGDENPMKEVAKSIVWGGLAGLVLGASIALATEGDQNDGNVVRWSFVAGTFAGLGMGLWWVSHRPEPTALLDVKEGRLAAHLALPEPGADGTLRLVAARVSF